MAIWLISILHAYREAYAGFSIGRCGVLAINAYTLTMYGGPNCSFIARIPYRTT